MVLARCSGVEFGSSGRLMVRCTMGRRWISSAIAALMVEVRS